MVAVDCSDVEGHSGCWRVGGTSVWCMLEGGLNKCMVAVWWLLNVRMLKGTVDVGGQSARVES
jgi:hypothetical protein